MLEAGRIRSCDWGYHGGSLEYDISYLHPDWDVVIQTYEIRDTTFEGKPIYASDFAVFLRDSNIPADFSTYPKQYKHALWRVIFAIKQRFLTEVRPDIVEHFIKAPYRAADRLAHYQRHLDLKYYDVVLTTAQTFTFFRR